MCHIHLTATGVLWLCGAPLIYLLGTSSLWLLDEVQDRDTRIKFHSWDKRGGWGKLLREEMVSYLDFSNTAEYIMTILEDI